MSNDLAAWLRSQVDDDETLAESDYDIIISARKVRDAATEITHLRARVVELEAQNDMLRHATDKLRAMLAELNARHEPLQRAFITAVELLNDAAMAGGKDE